MPMPAMAVSAPAAWTTATGRYCAMRCRCSRSGVVTEESRSMAPATNNETAARRRMRRTRMWSAATSGRGRPRRAARPAGRQLRVDVGGLGAALDDGVGRDEPLAHGGQRQVGLGQEQAHVQLRPGLDLEGRLLAVVQERGREPEAPPVLVHDLGGGARAGEEAGIEMGQLGHERPAHDDARGPGLDGGPRGIERVLPVQLELGVGDRPRARTGRRPTEPADPRRRAPARCRAR